MIYFDNAATSMPKAQGVCEAMCHALKSCGNPGRSGHSYSLTAAETIYNCRKRLAKMFNTRPEYVIFTSGATEALNIAIKGCNFSGGVTVVSSMEHNSVMRPLNYLRRNGETLLRQFRVDTESDLSTLENFSVISRSATNVVLTHASNVCGRILPIKQLRSLTYSDTVFILDASQTAGHIPIDIVDLEVDIICVPAHKGLCGPQGVGALIINPHSEIIIESLIQGGTGTNSKSLEMPEYYPEKLEAGTQNICGIAGFLAALENFKFPDNELPLFKYLIENLKGVVDITLYGAPKSNYDDYVPVLLFNHKKYDCESLCDTLAQMGFALRAGFHCAPNAHKTLGTYATGGARLSLGKCNTKEEIDMFSEAISKL